MSPAGSSFDADCNKAHPSGYSLLRLTAYFLRLGTFGFGGPIALAGYMQRDLVERHGWVTEAEYVEGLALSQLAPGPLAAQLAMYLGFVRAGIWGATLVGLAFIGPSFLMVIALAFSYVRFGGLPWIQAVFYGISAAVVAIIARSAWKLTRMTIGKDRLLWIVFLLLAVSTAITEKEIVWLFLAGGILSLIVKAFPHGPSSTSKSAFILLGIGTTKLTDLFFFFAKAGLFVFGSGLAIVPFLHGGVVLEHRWLTETQFLDAVAVAMVTPGPVVITVAFIGYLVDGFWGGVAAALGVFLPVYIVVLTLGPSYKKLAANQQLQAFVKGVTAAATGAIAGAVFVLARRSLRDIPTTAIAVITMLVLAKWKVPEPIVIAAAGIAGLCVRHS